MFNFDFLEKGLGTVSPQHFVYVFSRKMSLMLYSINWPKYIIWSPLLIEILGNMCIAVINLIFLIKSFLRMIKESRYKFKYLEIKKSF